MIVMMPYLGFTGTNSYRMTRLQELASNIVMALREQGQKAQN